MRMPNTIIWLASNILNTRMRPMRSDSNPQNSRPAPLQSELAAISVAPYSASVSGSTDGSASAHTSCSSGD